MLAKIREKLSAENGYALVMMALSFSILLGFTGLAVDAGRMFQSKRQMQIAADAASTAATLDYLYNGSVTSAKAAGKAASAANGFTDGSGGVTVSINNPPSTGPNTGSTNYFEAIVSQNVPTLFMATVGTSTLNVAARGVAGLPAIGGACIWLMDATGVDLSAQGSFNLQAPGCGVYMNSTSSSAVSVTGNGGTLNALYADAVGGSIGHQTTPTAITTYTTPRKSPWGNLTGPTPTVTTTTTGTGSHQVITTTVSWTGCDYVDSTTTTLGSTTTPATTYTTAGTIIGGAGKVMCFSNPITINNATFGSCSSSCTTAGKEVISQAAGTLAFAQGLTIPTGMAVTIYGGTIDIAKGSLNQASNTPFSIVAPTTGTYNAVALMEPSTNTNTLSVQWGSNNQIMDGYIYAPNSQVALQDNGGGITASGIVADNLALGPSTITIPSYDAVHSGTTPNRVVTLVE